MFTVFAVPHLWMLVLAGLAGLVVCILGLRGRREGQEPHCRKCAYNLTGLTSNRCPECGSYLTARSVVKGMPHCRWPWLVCGGVPFVLCAWLLGSLAYPHVRMVNLYRYLSSDRLIADTEAGRGRALYELLRRDSERELSTDEIGAILHVARANLEHRPVPLHVERWLEWMNRWDQRGQLGAEQQAWFRDYLARLVIPMLSGPVRVRSGNPLPLKLTHRCLGPFGVYCVGSELSVPGHDLPIAQTRRKPGRPGPIWDQDIRTDFGAANVDLEPGRYLLTYRGRYAFYRPGRHPVSDGGETPLLGSNAPVAIHEKTTVVELEVLPPFDPQQVLLVHNPEVDAQVRKAVVLDEQTREWSTIGPDGQFLRGSRRAAIEVRPADETGGVREVTIYFVTTPTPPVDLAFQVILRGPEGDSVLGTVMWPKGKPVSPNAEFQCVYESTAETARVILRTDPQAAREAWDVAEIWDGELELGPAAVLDWERRPDAR